MLGTLVEVRAAASTAAGTERAIRAAFVAVERVQALMSFHDPISDLGRLNREAARRTVRVHAWTHRVLRYAIKLHVATRGLFDIAVAPTLVRDGWLPRADLSLPRGRGTVADITLLPKNQVRFDRPLLLDLGGIAKGFAVDRAVAALRRHGAATGVVNAGGDLRVFGPQPETVHVRLPESPGTLMPLVNVCDAAIATSGHYYAQRHRHDGPRTPIFHPLLRQLATEARSVTVQAPTCWLADALCKVVWLAGADALPLLQTHKARAWVREAPAQPRQSAARHHAA